MPRCHQCKAKYIPRFFLQKTCEDVKCIIEYSKTQKEKKEAKEWLERKKTLKEKLKTLSEYEAEAKKSFQKWVRLRDEGLPCISCGNTKTNDWAGGHYYAAGSYSGLMFNPVNCHKQCNTFCNKHLSGNLLEYRKGLIERYGITYVEKLESLADSGRYKKYTKEELIQVKKTYDNLIKQLEK